MIRSVQRFLPVLMTAIAFVSCEVEDPGPLQDDRKEFTVIDFDRLEMGSALHIEVVQGNTFRVMARGDRRNINDLEVFKQGTTLVVRFDENTGRRHDTFVTITMPELVAANFSGASVSTVEGFESDGALTLYLSGASVAQLDAGYRQLEVVVSGASSLMLHGLGDELDGEISGSSVLSAFDYPVREATLNVSGSSNGKVTVTDALKATATGASAILYRGNPSVVEQVSGGSSVIKY
ncbi:MAG TPA: head GIN domain-containing protein [Ohtaekwangia sp.]|nr:head GIN domain-containing protein [Ohtaekwangia sp.]